MPLVAVIRFKGDFRVRSSSLSCDYFLVLAGFRFVNSRGVASKAFFF